MGLLPTVVIDYVIKSDNILVQKIARRQPGKLQKRERKKKNSKEIWTGVYPLDFLPLPVYIWSV